MAKPHQMEGITEDFRQLRDYLVRNGEISYRYSRGDKAVQMLHMAETSEDQDTNPSEQYVNEAAQATVHWMMKKRLGILPEEGAVFANETVTSVRFEKPLGDVSYIDSSELPAVAD